MVVEEITHLLDGARAAINRYHIDDGAALLEVARRLLETAEVRLPRDLVLRLGVTESWVVFERSGIAAAADQLTQLRRECLTAGEWGLVGTCDLQHGILLTRTGDLTSALRLMRDAGRHQAAMRVEDQVRLSLNRGTLLYQLGEVTTAAEDFRVAAHLATVAQLPTQLFKALHNQGCAAFVQGDLPLALRLMDEAEAHRGEVNAGLTLLDKARVLAEAGLVQDSATALRESAAAFTAGGLQREVAEIDVELARCEVLLGSPTQAAERAAGAARAFHDRGEPHWEHRARLVKLHAETVAGDGAAKEPEAGGALSRATSARSLVRAAAARGDTGIAALARVELAEALCDTAEKGDPAAVGEAVVALDEAHRLARSPYLAARLGYAHARVRSDLAGGRVRQARSRLARAAQDLAGAQRRTAGLDARTALAVHARRLAELDLDLALRSGDPIAVLHRVERWRRAVAPLTPVRPPPDPEEALLLSRLRQARENLAQAPPGGIAQARADVRRLERDTSAARWRVNTASADHAAGQPTYDEVRTAVRTAHAHDTAVLALLTVHGRSLAVEAAPGERPRILDLGSADTLRVLTDRVVRDAAAAPHAADNPHLSHLVAVAAAQSMATLDDALSFVLAPRRGQRLMVLAGASSGAIPWGMLPSRRGAPTTLATSLLVWAGRVPGQGRHAGHQASGTPHVRALAGPDVPHGAAEAAAVLASWSGGDPREAVSRQAPAPAGRICWQR